MTINDVRGLAMGRCDLTFHALEIAGSSSQSAYGGRPDDGPVGEAVFAYLPMQLELSHRAASWTCHH
jgi:hypothetical protein